MAPSQWKNFRIWRGRLPHWRADGVSYYVTFRHRRPLDPDERGVLFGTLLKPEGREWSLLVLCVRDERTDLILTLNEPVSDGQDRLTKLVERAKSKAGKAIVKRTGERFPPFYTESYDRILRDEAEMETYCAQVLSGPSEGDGSLVWVTPSSTDPAP